MPDSTVELRKYPYPYRAMLAICSDLDETPDRHAYWEIMRFLNTTETTSMGPGVGLEVGNSIYFDMPPDQFAYWNTDDAGREMVRNLIRSGHIDCLHSYGDLATTRSHAGRALDELAKHDCRLEVWVDHGTAATNFGADIMQGHGDEPGHAAYHADLTCDYGINYVWRGRVTSVIGQDAPASLGGIFTLQHPLASVRTVAKEAAKRVLTRCGNHKYAMHAGNVLSRQIRLGDGHNVEEFIRCNPHWGGVSCGDRATRLGEVITAGFLDQLLEQRGACILYTHLGKIRDRHQIFPESTRQVLRLLADYRNAGRILVTTTRRLLAYCRAVREVSARLLRAERGPVLELTANPSTHALKRSLGLSDLDGLTLYVSGTRPVRVLWNGAEVKGTRIHPADDTDTVSVSLPWRRLSFPGL